MCPRAPCVVRISLYDAVLMVSNVAKRSMVECRYRYIMSSCTSLNRITCRITVTIIVAGAHAHVMIETVATIMTRHGSAQVSAIS